VYGHYIYKDIDKGEREREKGSTKLIGGLVPFVDKGAERKMIEK
jgi:hypothetical protein